MESMRAIPLYRLADLREQLENELFFSEGELTPDQERRFDAITGSADKKIARIGLLICEALATAKAIEHEVSRLTERRRALLRREVEQRKEFLRLQMIRLGKRRVVGRFVTVSLHGNSTLSIDSVTPSSTGPQSDLFARGRGHHRRAERGQHVRVR